MRELPVSGHCVRFTSPRRTAAIAAVVLAVATAGCGRGESAAPAGGAAAGRGAAMALPVDAITLQPRPVEQVSEFVATIKSRHSITIQPQVEGYLTKINVKSGDHVQAGSVLMEIDDASQQAAVATLESVVAAREADVAFARQQAQRVKTMLDVGASSQQEYDQALTTQKTADAQLKAVQQQVRQQKSELNYYKVTAPTAGVVGDVPVRQGERVTRATQLTTLDDNQGLEIYINVPVQQAPNLRIGLPVRLLNDAGEVIVTEKLTFVAPSVDDTTQTILAKAALSDRSRGFRPDQFVRAAIVWASPAGLVVPVVATMRINGQYFVYVAEPSGGGLVAKQRQVVLGAIVGNDYVVQSGLKAGEQVITGGIQKIADGAPVQILPARGRQ